jgi:sugar-specific transcriptional regulator TrmB
MELPPENPARTVECLKSLGLTKYEALVYIALLRVMSATASEIHETSGVPRASVYPVLDQLQDKDLVSVSQSVPKRFAAVSPDEAITRLLSRIEGDATSARHALLAVHKRRDVEQGREELIWNIYGVYNIRKKLADLITGAKKEVKIIAHPRILSDEIRIALAGMADHTTIEIITPHWKGEIPGKMRVYLKKYPGIPKEMGTTKDMMAGGICIIDRCRVMVIMGSAKEDAVALFSESKGFLHFFIRYYNLIFDWVKKTG